MSGAEAPRSGGAATPLAAPLPASASAPASTPAPASASTSAAHAALAAVQVLFGLWPVIGILALRALGSAAALVGLRLALGAPIVALAAGILRKPLPARADLVRLAWLAGLGISLNQLLFVAGLGRAGPIHASVLGLLIPPFTVVIAALTGRERPSRLRMLGVAISVLGAAILVRPDRFDPKADAAIGDLMLFASAGAYSAYLVLAREMIARLGALTTVAWVMVLGAIEAAPFVAAPMAAAPWLHLSATAWAALAFVVLGATVLTYILNAFALSRVPSSVVAIYVALQPLVAAGAAALILGTSLSADTGLAAGTLALGLVLATR